MRLDPLFALCVAGPLLLTGLAVAPVGWGGDDAPTQMPTEREAQALPDTGWIGPFAQRLSARDMDQPATNDRDPLQDWRLVGLVQGDEGVWVTVTGRGDVRTLTVGEDLAGFELVRVEDGAAVFRHSGEERMLRLPR